MSGPKYVTTGERPMRVPVAGRLGAAYDRAAAVEQPSRAPAPRSMSPSGAVPSPTAPGGDEMPGRGRSGGRPAVCTTSTTPLSLVAVLLLVALVLLLAVELINELTAVTGPSPVAGSPSTQPRISYAVSITTLVTPAGAQR